MIMVMLAVAAVLTALTSVPASAAPAFSSTCGNSGSARPVKHVILVMVENKSYDQIIGSKDAPYQNGLAKSCGLATNYFGLTHSSSANYLGLSAGKYPAQSPRGCGSVAKCTDPVDNLYHQLAQAGDTWAGFMEGMPSNCDRRSVPNVYKIGHDPMLFYPDDQVSCPADDVHLSSLTARSGPFYADLQNPAKLPSFTWVTPDESHDGELGTSATQQMRAIDTFLSTLVPLITSSASYQAGNTLLLITYDEGSGPGYKIGEDCIALKNASCHVPLFVVYPCTKAGAANGLFFDHYSITKTVENLFHLSLLGHASDSGTRSLVNEFGIPAPSAQRG